MSNDIQDALITARKRLEICLDLFDDVLVASRSYHPAIEACFDTAHFMGHQALEAVGAAERLTMTEAGQ